MKPAFTVRALARLAAALVTATAADAFAQQSTSDAPQASAQDVITASDTSDDGFRWYRPTAMDGQLPIPQPPQYTPPPPWLEPHSRSGIGVELGGWHHFAGNYAGGQLLGGLSSFYAARLDLSLGDPTIALSLGVVEPANMGMMGFDVHFVKPFTLWRSSDRWIDVELLLPALRARLLYSFDPTETMMIQGSAMLGGVRLFACNRLQIDWRLEGPSFWWIRSYIAVRQTDGSLVRLRPTNELAGWGLSWGSSLSASVLF